jgi:hypothetical protein
MAWPVLIFGWGPALLATAGFCLAIHLRRPSLAIAAAVIAIPFLITVSGYPHAIGRLGGPAAMVANFGSAWMLGQRRRGVAIALLIPFLAVVVVLAKMVVTQSGP